MSQSGNARYHFMDAARALCMLLGIPFHTALIYGTGHWRIDSPQDSLFIEMIARTSQTFRMPTFFLIAGFFAAMMLKRGPAGGWLGQRAPRLWVPLLCGALLLNPFQVISGVFGNSAILPQDRAVEILRQLSNPGALVAHLWFLAALFWMSAGLASVWRVVPALHQSRPWAFMLHDWRGITLSLAVLVIWQAALLPWLGQSGLPLYAVAGLVNLPATLGNLPWFLLGAVLFLDSRTFERFLRPSPLAFVLAVGLMMVWLVLPEIPADIAPWIRKTVQALCGVFISRAVLALLYRFADRETPMVRDLVDVSFTIYLFHQPVVVLLGLAFLSVAWPPVVEFALICTICLAVTWVIGHGVARSPVLRFLFNGVPPKRRGQAPAPLAVPAE